MRPHDKVSTMRVAVAVERAAPFTKKSSYIPALDGLRALAFLMVFGAHMTGHTISKYIPATFGVTVFFFLSGYLITTLLRQEAEKTGTIALKDFYIRRSLRIFIPMYVAYVFSGVLQKVLFGWHVINLRGFLSTIFYCFNYLRMFNPPPILPRGFDVIWSLSVEEHFYLLFPCLFLFLTRRRVANTTKIRLILILCIVGGCWRTYVALHHFPALWTYYATDCRFDSILWGCLLAIWNNPRYDLSSSFLERRSGLLAALALGTIIATMNIESYYYRETIRYSLQGVCLYFIFFFAIRSTHHWSVRWLENKALRYIGWISYSLYLIHRPIADMIGPYLPPRDWVMAISCFTLSLAYAWLIRISVELPLQRLRARFRHAEPPISPTMPLEGI